MQPIVQRTFHELIANIQGEISQQENKNAYTRLFLIGETSVAKVCCQSLDKMAKNLTNLRLICQAIEYADFPELVLPTALIEHKGITVGYVMPYIRGVCLDEAIINPHIADKIKIDWFNQLANLILKLPPFIHLGDLHGRNIIIDTNNRIRLIDVDGFSVDSGHALTCPLLYDPYLAKNLYYSKYFYADKRPKISLNSDIYCLFDMFFYFLLDGINPFIWPKHWIAQFFPFLAAAGINIHTVAMIKRIIEKEDNYLFYNPLQDFALHRHKISYQAFLQETGLYQEEQFAEKFLYNIKNKQHWGR